MAALGLMEFFPHLKSSNGAYGFAMLLCSALQTIVGFGKEPPTLKVKAG